MAKIHLWSFPPENPKAAWPWCWCGVLSVEMTLDAQKATCKRCLKAYTAWKKKQAET
jgi:hypothetical protein